MKEIIEQIEKEAAEHWESYSDTGDSQTQGFALGLDRAVEIIKELLPY